MHDALEGVVLRCVVDIFEAHTCCMRDVQPLQPRFCVAGVGWLRNAELKKVIVTFQSSLQHFSYYHSYLSNCIQNAELKKAMLKLKENVQHAMWRQVRASLFSEEQLPAYLGIQRLTGSL